METEHNRHFLHVAALHSSVTTLGPGRRFVIWVQGCCFDCLGCTSPHWRNADGGMSVPVDRLCDDIIMEKHIEGITLSGGEPMMQAAALGSLVSRVRSFRDLSVICYTGFDLDDLNAENDPDRMRLISMCDVLVDGLYIADLNDNRGLRGSSNQKVHFLTSRYSGREYDFVTAPRKIQLQFAGSELIAAGVPPVGFADDLRKIINTL